jgi:alpha-ribazole phosphatase
MTELILIRHGETSWNREGRYTGQADIPLNERGVEQAQALAAQLQAGEFQAIFSSDLRRAADTAGHVAAATGAPLQYDACLREIHQGDWEGLLFEEVRTRFGQIWHHWQKNPLDVAPPGGETVGAVRERVLRAVEDICHRYPSGRVAIVAHGLVLALIKAHAMGAPIQSIWELIPPNAEPQSVILEAV